jgi:hypothetical protein
MNSNSIERIDSFEKIIEKTMDLITNKNKEASKFFIVYNVNETAFIVNLEEGKKPTLQQLQKEINGYIAIAPLRGIKSPSDLIFVVDEDGLCKNLPKNTLAAEIFGVSYVGNVILMARKLFN